MDKRGVVDPRWTPEVESAKNDKSAEAGEVVEQLDADVTRRLAEAGEKKAVFKHTDKEISSRNG